MHIRIRKIEDCLMLRNDLNRFSAWCGKLGLSLNLLKVMSYSKTCLPITFSYQLNGSDIERSFGNIMDLGFKFNTTLGPGDHIDFICCKTLITLGFIMRLARDFHLGSLIKSLYCALMRPILEYGTVVWNPHTVDNSWHIERVQRRFLRFTSYLLNIPCDSQDYTPVSTVLNLDSLAERWCAMEIIFLKGLLNNKMDSA